MSNELEAALDRWAAKEDRPRAQLIGDVLVEAVDAHNQGRAMFAKPDSINPERILLLPRVSIRTGNQLLGGGEQAICALVN